VLKLSAKSYKIWEKYAQWLKEQKIKTIVDFESWVTTKFVISIDKEYVKVNTQNEKSYYKKGGIRYGQ